MPWMERTRKNRVGYPRKRAKSGSLWTWAAPKKIAAARVSSGYNRSPDTAVKDARLQIKEGDQWKDAPGGSLQSNYRVTFVINLANPVTAQHVRLVSSDDDYMRIYELELYDRKLKDRPMVVRVECGTRMPGSRNRAGCAQLPRYFL